MTVRVVGDVVVFGLTRRDAHNVEDDVVGEFDRHASKWM